MPGMDRLNTCARMTLKGILGKDRCRAYLAPIERLLLDNYDEESIRGVAKGGLIPESTLRCILHEVRREMEYICRTEGVSPEMLLVAKDEGNG